MARKIKFLLLFVLIIFTATGCGQKPAPVDNSASVPSSMFSDVSVIVFAGGDETDPIALTITKGAEEAKRHLNCNVKVVYSGWNPEKMKAQFEEALLEKPSGIAFQGLPGDDVMAPLVAQAIDQGTLITTLNTRLPKLEEYYKQSGMGFVGQDAYKASYSIAKTSLERAVIAKGDSVLILGSPKTQGYNGALAAYKEFGAIVDNIDVTPVIESDPVAGTTALQNYLKKNPEVKIIYVNNNLLTSRISKMLTSCGKQPGDIFVVGSGVSADTAAGVKEGWIGLLSDQQGYLQGYTSVLQICLAKKYMISGFDLDASAAYIDSNNVDRLIPLISLGIR